MSARLFSLALDADMPSRSAKLVLVKLVDCCDDDGRRIFPSVATLAQAALSDVRTVQRVLRDFCAAGLLRKLRAGGSGPGSTASYELNIGLLQRLASEPWASVVRMTEAGGPESPCENKGDTMSPLESERVTKHDDKGDNKCHPTPQEEPLNQRERARGREAGNETGNERQENPDADPQGGPDAQPESEPPGTPTLDEFRKAWPSAAFDGQERLRAAWAALPFAARAEAVRLVPAYLAAAKAAGKRHVPSGCSYLTERLWLLVPEMHAQKAAEAQAPLPRFSRGWWAVLLARLGAGRPVGAMVDMAFQGRDWGASAREIAEAKPEALRPFPAGGPVFERWRRWLEPRARNRFDFSGETWVFLPGEWPPGMMQDEGGDL